MLLLNPQEKLVHELREEIRRLRKENADLRSSNSRGGSGGYVGGSGGGGGYEGVAASVGVGATRTSGGHEQLDGGHATGSAAENVDDYDSDEYAPPSREAAASSFASSPSPIFGAAHAAGRGPRA